MAGCPPFPGIEVAPNSGLQGRGQHPGGQNMLKGPQEFGYAQA